MKVVAAAILALYTVQIALYSAGVIELVAAAMGFVVVVVGVGVWARRSGFRRGHLGLRRPAAVYVVAGVLIGASAWYVNLWIIERIQPPGDTSGLQKVVEQTPLVTTLLALALLPAVTEEILFRGVFVRALAARLTALRAIVISSAVFALYHLLPAQMITTFLLGLLLGLVTVRARSAIPAIVAHMLNNVIAVVVARDEVPGLSPWMGAHPVVMLVGTSLVLAGGIALAARGGAA